MTCPTPAASILIVEDDAAEARRLEAALVHLGHRPTLAEDGDAALACLAAERFDLILLDLVLPGLDGMGVLGALAARGSATPVVVAVSPAGIDGARSALKAGARDFVVKPAGALRLEVAIGNALALARLDTADVAAQPASPRASAGVRFPADRMAETTSAIEEPSNPLPAAPLPHSPMSLSPIDALPMGRVIQWPRSSGLAAGTEKATGADPFLGAGGHVRPLEAIEAEAIRFALTFYGGRMSEAARHLGIGRSTLYRKLATFDVPEAEPYAPAFVAAE